MLPETVPVPDKTLKVPPAGVAERAKVVFGHIGVLEEVMLRLFTCMYFSTADVPGKP